MARRKRAYLEFKELLPPGESHADLLEIARLGERSYLEFKELLPPGESHTGPLEIARLGEREHTLSLSLKELLPPGESHADLLEIAWLLLQTRLPLLILLYERYTIM